MGGDFGGVRSNSVQVLIPGSFTCCTKPGFGLFFTNLTTTELVTESLWCPVFPVPMGSCSPGSQHSSLPKSLLTLRKPHTLQLLYFLRAGLSNEQKSSAASQQLLISSCFIN